MNGLSWLTFQFKETYLTKDGLLKFKYALNLIKSASVLLSILLKEPT